MMGIAAALATLLVAIPAIILEEARPAPSIWGGGALLVMLLVLIGLSLFSLLALKQLLMRPSISLTDKQIHFLGKEIPVSAISRLVCNREGVNVYWADRGKVKVEAIWLYREDSDGLLNSMKSIRPDLPIEFK